MKAQARQHGTRCHHQQATRSRCAVIAGLIAILSNGLPAASAQTLDGFAPVVDGGLVRSLALQPDGAILAGGSFTGVDGLVRSGLMRIYNDAIVDTTLAPNDDLMSALGVSDIVVYPDGRILAAYTFGARRYFADGSEDPSFSTTNPTQPSVLALQPDGKIVVGEWNFGVRLMRLEADGSVDPTFHQTNMLPGAGASRIIVQADGSLLVAGTFYIDGEFHGLARFRSDGTHDESFHPDFDQVVSSILPLASGDLIVGGSFTRIGPYARRGLALLNKDGRVKDGFDHAISGGGTNPGIWSIAIDHNGVVIAGDFDAVGGVPRSNLARIGWDNSIDASFDPDVTGIVQTLAVQGDGKIVIGGAITQVGNHIRNRLARINPDGSVDDSFGAGANGPVYALSARADSTLLIGGAYSMVQDGYGQQTPAPGLSWIIGDGNSLYPGFGPQEICEVPFCGVHAIVQDPDGRIDLGHGFFNIGRPHGAIPQGIDALPILQLFPGGAIDPIFYANVAANVTGDVNALLREADGRLLVAGCLGVNTLVDRFNLDGTRDASFIPFELPPSLDCADGYAAYSLARVAGGRIAVGGHFLYDTAIAAGVPNLAVLAPDGDQPANRPLFAYADGDVLALAALPGGGVMIGGDFAFIGDFASTRIGRLLDDATIDRSVGFFADAPVRALAARADGRVFVGGDFSTINGIPRSHLALINDVGDVAGNFDHSINGSVHALALQPDGKLAVGGQFTTVDGLTHANIVRFRLRDPASYAISYVRRVSHPPWIYWDHAGSGPAAAMAPQLSYSLDGANYTPLGAMSAEGEGRWKYDTFTPPFDRTVFLRVRTDSSTGSVDAVREIFDADTIFADTFESSP